MPEPLRSLKTLIRCSDLAASRAFYEGVLGLRVVEEWDEDEDVGCVLSLAGGDAGLLELAQARTRERAGSSATVELQIRTDSLNDWAEALDGVCPMEGPLDRPWGHRYLWLRDPDGLRIALYEVTEG